MTKIRLLKILRVKVGRATTEETGHLGIVDLISTVHVSRRTGSEMEAGHIHAGPQGTDWVR